MNETAIGKVRINLPVLPPVLALSRRPRANPSRVQGAFLDARSYHVFHYRDDFILYDLSTTTVCLIDLVTFEILRRAGQMGQKAIRAQLNHDFPKDDISAALNELETLCLEGFFCFAAPASSEQITEQLNELVNHSARRIQLLVAQKCNLACSYCYAEDQGSNALNKLMSWDTAKQAVDHFTRNSKERKNLTVSFFGGEPLLNFRLIKRVVRYCRQTEKQLGKRYSFTITTNGTLLDDAKIDFLVRNKFSCIISIDGGRTSHNHQRPSRNGSDVYDLILNNARRLQARLDDPTALTIRANTTALYPSRSRMADDLADEGFSAINVQSIQERRGVDNPLAITSRHEAMEEGEDERFLERFLESLSSGSRLTYNPCEEWLRQLKNKRTVLGISCGVCRNMTTVGAEGVLFPCHRYEGMMSYAIGTVVDGVDSDRVLKYYRTAHENSEPGCGQCWARVSCGGACTWLLTDNSGYFNPPTEYHCNQIRSRLEKALWLFARMQRDFAPDLRRIMTS